MTCTVSRVRRSATGATSHLSCRDGAGVELPLAEGWPGGYYSASATAMFRTDRVPAPEALIVDVSGDRTAGAATVGPESQGRICRDEQRGLVRHHQCFRGGAGLVNGFIAGGLSQGRSRAIFTLRAVTLPGWAAENAAPDTTEPLVVINEVATAKSVNDWFEIVNVSGRPLDLAELAFVDHAGALDRLAPFDAVVLAPGARHVQKVSSTRNGFQLGHDEALSIHRMSDLARVAHLDWDADATPVGKSFARVPDTTGAFRTVDAPTPGDRN